VGKAWKKGLKKTKFGLMGGKASLKPSKPGLIGEKASKIPVWRKSILKSLETAINPV
jgi:hypothetical protein